LQVSPRLDDNAGPIEGHVEPTRELFGAVELRSRGGAKPMIDSVGEKAECAPLSDLGEHMEKGHRVWASAHGHENGRPARYEVMVANCGAHERDERGRVGPRHRRLATPSGELEGFAELEVRSPESVAARCCLERERAGCRGRLEMRAIVTREAESELLRFLSQLAVDACPHVRSD
jgi:hypothetical protein